MRYTYEDMTELSKKGDEISLKILFDLYLNDNKNISSLAKSPLIKTRGNLTTLLDEYLDETKGIDIKKHHKLALIGIRKYPSKYLSELLYDYSNEEYVKAIIQILSDMDWKNLSLLKSAFNLLNSSDFILPNIIISTLLESSYKDSVINKLLQNAVNRGHILVDELTYLSDHLEIIKANQEIIRNSINREIFNGDKVRYYKYLNFNDKNNIQQYLELREMSYLYQMLKCNYFISEIRDLKKYNDESKIIIKLAQNIPLSDEEKYSLNQYLFNKITGNEEDINYLIKLKVEFVESLPDELAETVLYQIHIDTRMFSEVALKALMKRKSELVFKELISKMITITDLHKKHVVASKLLLNYREKAKTIMSYVTSINNPILTKNMIEKANQLGIIYEETSARNITIDSVEYKSYILDDRVLLDDFINQICNERNINEFYCAVGFLFESGLRLIRNSINRICNAGLVEYTVGSLQTYNKNSIIKKMNKGTAEYLNDVMEQTAIRIYTYAPEFYHGKFYYLTDGKDATVIIGSSNVSKTAFLQNRELNVVYEFSQNSSTDEYFRDWYEKFKNECVRIGKLDVERFTRQFGDIDENIPSTKIVMSLQSVQRKIDELTDDETKYRLSLWMQKHPSNVYEKLDVDALSDYILFEYKERGLAVLESFVPYNAYYCFLYDDLDVLLEDIRYLSKTELTMSNDFVSRGYHIQNRDTLQNKIEKLFAGGEVN